MSFTPEGRAKALATKARKKAERLAAERPAAELPQTLADLGLEPAEEDFRIDDILTNEQIEEIERRAEEEVAAEEKKARARSYLDAAKHEARRKRGLVPADEARQREDETRRREDETRRREMEEIMPEKLRITLPRLRTPPPNSRDIPPDPIILDQRMFHHGVEYKVTRAQYEYLTDRMFQAWQHMAQVEGRVRTYYSDTLSTNVAFNGFGRATGGGYAPSFDAVHRRPA